MKTLILSLCLIASFSTFANEKYDYKKEKKISKDFSIDKNGKIDVKNQFGDISIVTWDENKVVFEITITVEGNNMENVQEKIDEINVDFNNTEAFVSAITKINGGQQNRWWSWSKSSKRIRFSIDYKIKMPKTLAAKIQNDYGTICLDYLEGDADISCDYGKILIGELHSETNFIDFDYTKNSHIDYIKGGEINADYSGIEIEKADNLEVRSDYSGIKIGVVDNLTFNNDYGSLKVDEVSKVVGNSDYITLRFGKLHEKLTIDMDYGSLKVGHIMPTAEKIDIETDYTGVSLGIDPKWHFNFEVDLEYAGFKYEMPLEIQIERKEPTEKYYQGYHLSKTGKGDININADYGTIKFLEL